MKFAILLILSTLTEVYNLNHCDKTIESDPYKLVLPKPIPITIKKETTTARYWIGPDRVETHLFRRSYFQAKTFGKIIAQNQVTIKDDVPFPPDERESHDWIERSGCAVGEDISMTSGGNSHCAKQPTVEDMRIFVGRQKLSKDYDVSTYYNGCFRHWECSHITSDMYTFAKVKPSTRYIRGVSRPDDLMDLFVYGPNFDDYQVFFTKYSYSEVDPDTRLGVPIVNPSTFQSGETNVTCFTSKGGALDCIIRCDCPLDGTVLTGLYNEWFCIRTSCFYIDKPIVRTKRYDSRRKKPASISDVESLNDEVQFDRDYMEYNILTIAKQVEKSQAVIIKMIRSLAKLDDHLLGEINEREATSHWITSDAFVLSPCLDTKAIESNCGKGLKFKEGRWIQEVKLYNDSIKCLNLKALKEFSIFEKMDTFLPKVHHLPSEGVIREESGWSAYLSFKAEMAQLRPNLVTKQDLPSENWMEEMSNGWSLFHSIMGVSSGMLTVLNTVAIIFLFCVLCARRL